MFCLVFLLFLLFLLLNPCDVFYFQIGVEGEGFEPAIEVLFGDNGFFPDAISKAMYWVNEKIPHPVKHVLDKWVSPLRDQKMKRQVRELSFL